MKLRELIENIHDASTGQEASNDLTTIGISYGRFNPPHKGHREVWKAASKNPIWYIGTNKSTSGPKDPLPYDVKLQCMAAVWPEVAGHVIPEQSLLTMAANLYNKYGENVHLKVYTDEKWLADTLIKYNGAESNHGMYKFAHIEHKATKRLASATDLRAAVRSGDQEAFYKDAGIPATAQINIEDKSYPLFQIVAHYLNKYPEKQNMKVSEVIAQEKSVLAELSVRPSGKMHPHQIAASQGYTLARDIGGYDRAYHQNRMGLAMAMADGKSKKPVAMDDSSWVEKYNVYFPFTDEEQMMVNQALATIPSDAQELEKRGKSTEPKDTNKTSPVAGRKKNKYGV